MSELITVGLGNFGVLTAAHVLNGFSRYDLEHNVVFAEGSKGTRHARVVLLDQAYPSRPVPNVALTVGGDIPDEEEATRATNVYWDPAGTNHENEDDRDDDNDDDDEEDNASAAPKRRTQPPKRHPSKTAARETTEDTDDDEDDDDLDENYVSKQVASAPPVVHTPWWRYIYVPFRRSDLSFLNFEAEPDGSARSHCFGVGLQQPSSGDTAAHGSTTASPHTALVTLSENCRRVLEAADASQGVQMHCDTDSAFGGLSAKLAEYLNDDCGVRAVAAFAAFPLRIPPVMSDDDKESFGNRFRDELVLNRALAYHHLSTAASLFLPMDVAQWPKAGSHPTLPRFDPLDEVATAAVIAATTDTALYGCRTAHDVSYSSKAYGGGVGLVPLWHVSGMLRVGNSYRVNALNALMPPPVAPVQASFLTASKRRLEALPPSLFDALTTLPMMNFSTVLPTPVTGDRSAATSTCAFEKDAIAPAVWHSLSLPPSQWKDATDPSGEIVAQLIALRGLGSLKDEKYPRETALCEYAKTAGRNFRVQIFDERYPVAGSFPLDRMLDTTPSDSECLFDREPAGNVKGFPIQTQLCNSYSSGTTLRNLEKSSRDILRARRHIHLERYGLEWDEFRETLEEIASLRDTYDRDPPSDAEDHDGDY